MSKEAQQKLRRLAPVIMVRKSRFDQELKRLEAIRQQKIAVVATLKSEQRTYLRGADELNVIRSAPKRPNLENMEAALDHVKKKIHQLYQSVRQLEQQERSQMQTVLKADREVRAIEGLKASYEAEIRGAQTKAEAKRMDEHALRKFTNSSATGFGPVKS